MPSISHSQHLSAHLKYRITSFYNFHPPLPSYPITPPTMNHSSPPIDDPTHSWFQSQQTPYTGEQCIPSTLLSYGPNFTLPSTSHTQDHVVNYTVMVNDQRTIPFEYLEQQTTLERFSTVGLKEVIFLRPPPNLLDFFRDNREVLITRVIHFLERAQSLEKITFPLDFTDCTRILKTLGAIGSMQEIELLPASRIEPYSMDMVFLQNSFIRGLSKFWNLKRLTIPMEFVTALLLSYLALLPSLETLTVKYSPPPRPLYHNQRFPEWSSYRNPAECPGYVFLAHLNFHPRGYFGQLSRLDLRTPLSDVSYTTLRTLFPRTHIC